MKKMLILAAIVLISALQFAAPDCPVPIDQDVGICYVAPMDQMIPDVMNIADNITIGYQYNSPTTNERLSTPAIYTRNTNNNRDLGGLDTGEVFPWLGSMARHI